jgi:hypothetical protein
MNDPNNEQRELGESDSAAEVADDGPETAVETVIEAVIYGIDTVATIAADIID